MSTFPVFSVPNYDASMKFYTETLGFKTEMSTAMHDGKMFGIFTLNSKETMVALNEDQSQLTRGQGVAIMLYPEGDFDIDAYYAKLQERGIKMDAEIKTEYWGDRVFTFKDPDGYVISIAKTMEVLTVEQALERAAQTEA